MSTHDYYFSVHYESKTIPITIMILMIIIIIMIVPTLLLLLLLLLLLCISKFTYVGPTGSICTAQKVHRSCSTAIVYGKVYCAS